jgi:hypothetical protein
MNQKYSPSSIRLLRIVKAKGDFCQENGELMNVRVKFLGGTGTVTGSRYLLDIGGYRLLFDCGLFQGVKEVRRRNWDPLPVDAASIHAW